MEENIKRGIYVGKHLQAGDWHLAYGMTGTLTLEDRSYGDVNFVPDGDIEPWMIFRKNVYIPAEDKTRYCPKP